MTAWRFHGLGRLVPVILVAACSSTAGTPQDAPVVPDVQVVHRDAPLRHHCDADAAASAVGTVYAPALLQSVLAAAGADEARMLHTDSIITKEYRQGRVNLVVDADGRVVRAYCG